MSKLNLLTVLDKGKDLWIKHGGKVVELAGTVETIQGTLGLKPKTPVHNDKTIVIDVVDHDDTYFEDMLQKLQEAANDGVKDPKSAMIALNTLMQCAQETIVYCEGQENKRAEILAKRDEVVAKINLVTAQVKDYIEKSFDERSKQFAAQFDNLDKALKDGDAEMLTAAVTGINSLASAGAFKELADASQVQQSLASGKEWDI